MPFGVEEFFGVFRAYNEAVWPAQLLLALAGLVALLGLLPRSPGWSRCSYLILAFLWLWMGLVYHWTFFAAINPLAPAFAILFVVAGVLLGWLAVRSPGPALRWRGGARGVIGSALVLYGLVVYPIIGRLSGHVYPDAPGFGLPCPTTIFTIGLLTFAAPWPRRRLLVVPVLWSAIGSTAAFSLGVPQDYGLAVAGIWAIALLVRPS